MNNSLLFDFNQRAHRDKQVDWLSRLGVALIIMQGFLSTGSAVAGQAKPGWEVEWEKTVAAARQEGQVTIYGATLIHQIVETGAFQKAYPGIRVVRGGGPPAGPAFQRLVAERRAGKYLADVYVAGVTSAILLHRMKALEPIKPLLVLPEVVDESKWLGGKQYYSDDEQRYIFATTAELGYGSISYNTNLVNVKEIRSFWDILHPKWKGKIESRDIRTPGVGSVNNIFFYHNLHLGPKFIRRLYGEMDITLFRDTRQATDWLASGKFAICFFCGDPDVAKKQGLPVDEFGLLKEGAFIHTVGGAVNFVNRAPHPNAAKVFLNWLLSREGQLTAQGAPSNRNSRRVDIPKDMLPEKARVIEGVKYLDVDNPELSDVRPVVNFFVEALDEAEKRKKGQ